MQDLDELEHVFLICAEFEVKKTSVRSFYKENNLKPCLAKQILNKFKLWCERAGHKFLLSKNRADQQSYAFWVRR